MSGAVYYTGHVIGHGRVCWQIFSHWVGLLDSHFGCLLLPPEESNYVMDIPRKTMTQESSSAQGTSQWDGSISNGPKLSSLGRTLSKFHYSPFQSENLSPVSIYRHITQMVMAGPEDPAFSIWESKRLDQCVTPFCFLKRLVWLAGWDPSACCHPRYTGGQFCL